MPSRHYQKRRKSPNPAEDCKSIRYKKKIKKSVVNRKSPSRQRNAMCHNNYYYLDGKPKPKAEVKPKPEPEPKPKPKAEETKPRRSQRIAAKVTKPHSPFDPKIINQAVNPNSNDEPEKEAEVAEAEAEVEVAEVEEEEVTMKDKVSSLKGLVNNINVMSCKEMREYVSTTDLSAQEKIKLLESNSNGNKQLNSFISSQHWNLKELRFYGEAGKFMVATLSDKIQDAKNFVLGGYDDSDPDCRYLKELLAELKMEQEKKNAKKEQTTFQKIKSYGWNLGEKGLGLLYSGANYILQKGMDLWSYISRDPKTAYFALLVLKNLKKKVCRKLGNIIGYTKQSSTLGQMRMWYEKNIGIALPDQTTLEQAKEWLTDVTGPIFKGKAIEFCGKSIQAVFDRFGNPLITGITFAVESFLPSFIGKGLAEGIRVVLNIAIEETKDAVEMSVEQLAYQTNVENAFGMFFEVINPKACLDDLINASKSGTKQEKEKRVVVETVESEANTKIDELGVSEETKKILKEMTAKISLLYSNIPAKVFRGTIIRDKKYYKMAIEMAIDAMKQVDEKKLTDIAKQNYLSTIAEIAIKFYENPEAKWDDYKENIKYILALNK